MDRLYNMGISAGPAWRNTSIEPTFYSILFYSILFLAIYISFVRLNLASSIDKTYTIFLLYFHIFPQEYHKKKGTTWVHQRSLREHYTMKPQWKFFLVIHFCYHTKRKNPFKGCFFKNCIYAIEYAWRFKGPTILSFQPTLYLI